MKLNNLFKLLWRYKHIWGPVVIDVVKPIITKLIKKLTNKNKKDDRN